MTGIPKDERGYLHLRTRAEALLEQARSAAARDRREPALLGLRSVLALIDLTRADGAAPAPPSLKGHLERIQRGAERELARLDPTFTPTLPARERPAARATPARAAPAGATPAGARVPARRRGTTAAKAPPRVVPAAEAATSEDPRVIMARITAGVSPEGRRLLLARVAELAADPALLPANDAAWVAGGLRRLEPPDAELAPIVGALMGRADVRRSKPALQQLGELCLDREAIAGAEQVFVELRARFAGDMVVGKLLSRRDAPV